ncbi:MAG TPA: hypothetical protein VFW97_14865 [Acidimicrobiia bacterium]|jgi:hypothetical protein|nr:hypothetical protein [Acidimicrobiia bacterium]
MTQATMARPHVPRRTFPPLPLIALVVVGVLLCAAMAYELRDPKVVSRLTLENPSGLDVNVSVQPSPSGSRLVLPTVGANSTATSDDVLDQGDEWLFSFSSGGVDGGTLRVSRAKLAAGDWRVEIPESVVQRLQTGTYVPAYRG